MKTEELDDFQRDNIETLFHDTEEGQYDSADENLGTTILTINVDEINEESSAEARQITERLSNYYFDEKYIREHPYVPNKIKQEMDNIRRLLKMLSVNEKAQDALITNITTNAGKGTLYAALTSLQNSMINIQTQLNRLTESLEQIFKDMQDECEKTFEEKDKENLDGSQVVRGSREFIRSLLEKKKQMTHANEQQEMSLFDDKEIKKNNTY